VNGAGYRTVSCWRATSNSAKVACCGGPNRVVQLGEFYHKSIPITRFAIVMAAWQHPWTIQEMNGKRNRLY